MRLVEMQNETLEAAARLERNESRRLNRLRSALGTVIGALDDITDAAHEVRVEPV